MLRRLERAVHGTAEFVGQFFREIKSRSEDSHVLLNSGLNKAFRKRYKYRKLLRFFLYSALHINYILSIERFFIIFAVKLKFYFCTQRSNMRVYF